ncbi:MAG: substrate-binding domain-containing protein [Chloroflexi bacterium]|nr:substrate-binding domain-containing protein [Chloroflexota bacterium]
MRARRPRIGYITPRISDQHGLAIWSGVVETAQSRGVDVLCFAGGEVQHPEYAGRRGTEKHAVGNAIYDLVDRGSLDGLVVWGSSLGYYAGPDATYDFCRRFQPLPLVSIGVALPGIPGVVLDSYGGTRAAMAHLIEVHGRRRLAFIRGPAAHREARERYRSYCDTLAAYGIAFDPDLVSPPYLWVQADGIELQANGAEAIRLFLDERRVRFDAVVAASDTFALGALPALQARGIQVPEQVSVVGFDDRPASRAVTPPLTTLKIRMRERGRQALSMLLARLAGESLPDEVSLPTRLVIRRSCGCFDSAVVRAGDKPSEPAAPATASATVELTDRSTQRATILAAIDRELESIDETVRHGPKLLDAYLAELLNGEGKTGSFLVTLDNILRQAVDAGGEVWAWQGVISALREQMLPKVAGDIQRLRRAESLWHQARVLIGERAWRAQAYADRYASQQSDRLHAISRALALAGDVPELMDILAAELPAMGIGSCAMALYENPQAPTGACRLVLAYDERGRASLAPAGEVWSAPALASGGLLADAVPQSDGTSSQSDGTAPQSNGTSSQSNGTSQHSIVIEPLYYRDEQLGFIMLDGSRREGQVYRVLQEQISGALKGVLLLQENVRLYHAALAAQQAAQEKQRLAEEANRLKSRFLSMVSHELRTPLILLEGLSEMMLREGLGDRPPVPAPYRQDLARIRATAQQLGGLVRDVLDLARSQVGQLRLAVKPLDMAAVLQPTILVGEQMARSKGLDWQVEIAPDLPEVCGDGARLQEVTLNLISNAVKFTAHGEVRLRIDADDSGVTVSVSDTGLGVPLDEQGAIFDEFRQSERTAARGFGGLGVGLAICRQIVHLHGGEIGVQSSGLEDGGSDFFFRLPVVEPAASGAVSPSLRLSAVGQPGAAPCCSRSQTVVLLTDQAANGELLQSHLLEQGFEVEVLPVEEGEDWLARLLARRPGAVVLDLQPTWERGWQLFDVLKHSEATQDIPVLLYSLLAERGQGAVLALDYLAKPMGIVSLAQALQNLGLADGEVQNKAILIADDDPEVLAMHGDIVRARFPNCRILTAANGRQALDILQRGERPLFVLLDLMMPELDGMGVLEAMQRDERLRDIPVIVLTAQCLSEDDMSHLSRGVASILQKGMFTTEETLARVEQALARNKRLGSETQRLVRRVMAYIHTNFSQDISREQMASYVGVSARHLTRCFAQEVGLSPIDYLNRFRVVQARRLLDDGHANITEVMNAVGFRDSSYFSKIFRREVGMSPSAYRRHAHTPNQPPAVASDKRQ